MSKWVELGGYGSSLTEAMEAGGGVCVRISAYEACTSVFIPNSHIVDGQVIKKPTRLQISESQNVLMSEVAAISKRPKELVFTLKCGKEIITTENIDSVLVAFMQVAP